MIHFPWLCGCQPKNSGGPPKSSILIGFSIIFTIHFGVPLFLETPMLVYHSVTSNKTSYPIHVKTISLDTIWHHLKLAPPRAFLSSEEGTHFADPKKGQENQQETWESTESAQLQLITSSLQKYFLLGPTDLNSVVTVSSCLFLMYKTNLQWHQSTKPGNQTSFHLPPSWDWITFPETNSIFAPESHGFLKRKRESVPTIHFQVLLLLVSGRVYIRLFFRSLGEGVFFSPKKKKKEKKNAPRIGCRFSEVQNSAKTLFQTNNPLQKYIDTPMIFSFVGFLPKPWLETTSSKVIAVTTSDSRRSSKPSCPREASVTEPIKLWFSSINSKWATWTKPCWHSMKLVG